MERVLLDGIQLIVVQMSAPTQITKSVKLFQLLESNMKLHQLQLRGTAEIGGCKTLDVVVHQIAAKAKSSHIITMIEIDWNWLKLIEMDSENQVGIMGDPHRTTQHLIYAE